jgi:hypothetical protein
MVESSEQKMPGTYVYCLLNDQYVLSKTKSFILLGIGKYFTVQANRVKVHEQVVGEETVHGHTSVNGARAA